MKIIKEAGLSTKDLSKGIEDPFRIILPDGKKAIDYEKKLGKKFNYNWYDDELGFDSKRERDLALKALKEGKIKEASKVDFFDILFDSKHQPYYKDLDDAKSLLNDVSNQFNVGQDPNPAVLYFNIHNYVDRALNKVAGSYESGEKDYTNSIDDLMEILVDRAKQTDKITKNLVTALGKMNKILLKLPKKE